MNKILAATIVTGIGILGAAAPTLAATEAPAAGSRSCTAVSVDSTRDNSNIGHRPDGNDTTIEVEDNTNQF